MITGFNDTIAVFDLPCGSLMRTYENLSWKEDTGDKSYFTKRKKENEELLRATEDMTDEDKEDKWWEEDT